MMFKLKRSQMINQQILQYNFTMQSSKSSIPGTSSPQLQNTLRSTTKLNQIDFNQALYIINAESQTSFSSLQKKKDLFTDKKSQKKSSIKGRSAFDKNVSNFTTNYLKSEVSNNCFNHLNQTFTASQNPFRVTFPIRRDLSKKKIQAKGKSDWNQNQSKSFVSSLFQLESTFRTSTATPKHQPRIQMKPKRKSQSKQSKTCLNFYTVEQIQGQNNRPKKLLIREIGKYHEEEQNIPKTTLINTVDEYLRKSVKRIPLKSRTKIQENPVIMNMKQSKSKREQMFCVQKGQNNS